jgi:hypothetical protein
MFPKNTFLNSVNGRNGHAEASGNVFHHDSATKKISDNGNVVINQLGILLTHSANMPSRPNTVLGVLPRRTPFEISKTIVRSVMVNVINIFSTFWRFAKKSDSHKAVDTLGYYLVPQRQSDLRISVPIEGIQTQQTPKPSPVRSSKTLNATKVGNFVHAFVPHYGLPNFRFKFFGGKVVVGHIISWKDSVIRLVREVTTPVRAVPILPHQTPHFLAV